MLNDVKCSNRRIIRVRCLIAAIILSTSIFWKGSLYYGSMLSIPLRDAQTQLSLHLYPLLEEHRPQCSPPTLHGNAGLHRFNPIVGAPQENHLVDPDGFVEPMQVAHDSFVQAIRHTQIERAYIRGTKGIVSSAGGKYLPTFIIFLRLLRRTGARLPVELFMKDWIEYEPYICEVVLPSLNGKCVVLSEVFTGPDGAKPDLEHFQLKAFSILFSSFQDVIWMDSDCFFLYDPTNLLTSKPFTSTGLVTWPDFWSYTVSPTYYNISRQAIIPTTARQSTEAGMFLISKKTHFMSLLLSAYYNYHASYFYTMISQGAPGEGDKDTFVLAASALGEKFHTVSEKVADLGHPAPDGGVLGAAMLHADPIEDYKLTRQGRWRVRDESVAKAPRGYWLHAYSPKFNAGEDLFSEKTQDKDGHPGRAYTSKEETLKRLGYDAERDLWEETKTVTCTLEHAFDSWKTKTGLCETVTKHWDAVQYNSNMQIKSLFVVLTGLMAFAAAAPAEAEARDTANVQARKSWTAEGGCKTDWAGRCNAQCIGEGVRSHGCKKGDISSGIESSHCVIGWNICKCSC
ncbi:mannosyltransferase putative-domain-containing protein [Aspergillus pseudocaelatus]|uniref:Mannosyltransferase putative-domain-containing protein n=1 Tax=Aspergillus pseudocaelatus TaxID=1825620 RepID=A0ABQ6W822_9EURO|nr:mannosyltransferase putative-domain-containing protein [Aspergillus pseudocaelatus]